MKNLTNEIKEDLFNIGYLGMGIDDILQNYDFDKQEVIRQFETCSGEIHQAWYKGWYTAKLELNKVMMDAAKNSSQPALLQMAKIRGKTEKNNLNLLNNE